MISRAKTMPVTAPQPMATSKWLPRSELCPQKGVTSSRQWENDKTQSTPMTLSQNQITSITYPQCWHLFLHSKSSAQSEKSDYLLHMASLSEVKWKTVSPVKAEQLCVSLYIKSDFFWCWRFDILPVQLLKRMESFWLDKSSKDVSFTTAYSGHQAI